MILSPMSEEVGSFIIWSDEGPHGSHHDQSRRRYARPLMVILMEVPNREACATKSPAHPG